MQFQKIDSRVTITTPFFGEVFRGMEVVDKIAAARDEFDNPLEPIEITMTVKE